MSQQYQIIFKNNSYLSGNFCCFQQDPTITDPSIMSLAWFTKFANPNTAAAFDWSIDYSFVWGETGPLVPGVTFSASQNVPAGLTSNNRITLDYNGGYQFMDQTNGTPSGNLYIIEDGTIPSVNEASVGIGMSGTGTFVMQAAPNYNLTFSPHPEYWVAFGTYTTGEVLNIQSMNNPAEVSFPIGVYTMYATLNSDNSWTISPTSPNTAVNMTYALKK